MDDRKRERALNQIVTLRLIAEDTRAPDGERQAARDTMAKLIKKYNIPERTTPEAQRPPWGSKTYTSNTTNPPPWPDSKWFEDMVREADKRQREDQARRQAAQAERQRREEAEFIARKVAERERAQREWVERQRNNDAMGQPLSPEDLKEARRDPLEWAAKQDKRTHQQKQDDLNKSRGQQRPTYVSNDGSYTPGGYLPPCSPKLTYFDIGGEPRERNSKDEICVMCGRRLRLRMGAQMPNGRWACCDTVPGPRNKKVRPEE